VSSPHDDEILGKAYDARLMRRLAQFLRPYWRTVVAAFVFTIVGSLASLVQPYLIKIAIDRFIAARQLEGLDRLAAVYLAVLVVAFAAEYAQTWTMQLTGQRIMFDLRMAIYSHLQRLDLRFYDRNPVGRLMTRVTSDVDVINDLFTSGVVTVFSDVFTLVGIMGILLGMNWRLALVTFAVLPLIVFIAQWFRRNVRDSYRVVRGWIARINAFLQENITGMTTVQLFRRERMNFARFDTIDREHSDANIDSIFYYAVFYPAIEVVSTLATSLIISNLVGRFWGPDPILVKPPAPLSMDALEIGSSRISSYEIALVVLTLILVAVVERVYRTLKGKAVMAVAEDREAALLRGIDPNSLSRWSFFLGAAFAAMTGILAAPILYASTSLGPDLLLKGFAAAAVGSIGNNRGALVAGYMIGVTEAFGASLLSPGYQEAVIFVVVLAVLLMKPEGLFGSPNARTV